MKRLSVLTAVLFFFLIGSNAQKLKTGPQDLSFFSKVDETDQPYAVYIPVNFDESREYPLVVFLHGAWSNHRLGLRRAFGQGNIQGLDFGKPGTIPAETDLEATRYFPELKEVDYIVAAPYARGTAGYQGIPEEDVYEMLDDLKSRFKIDEDRIYLTGLSMGGGGTIWLSLTRPDIWAAIAPVCPAPPEEAAELSGNACNLPVHLFIGDRDFLYKTAQEWKERLGTATAKLDYTVYPGVAHNSWEYAYKDGYIFEWFSQYARDSYPDEVCFSARWYKYNKAYWVILDNFTPGTLASIKARFTSGNQIDVETDELEAFSLNVSGHPRFTENKQVKITVDGKSFTLRGPGGFSFSRDGDTWVNRKYAPGLTSKRPGAEGPLYAAFGSNHVYVYGTAGKPSPEELASRRAVAESAADWSGMGGRIMVFPRVIADTQVRESDYEHSNLVLFGDRNTNSVIANLSGDLPLHLGADAKDHGLVYIFPYKKHYIVVNSGLPWWTPAGKQGSGATAFSGAKPEALKNSGDYILFEGSMDNVIVKGNFDNNWKLPDDAARLLIDSGVIGINEK